MSSSACGVEANGKAQTEQDTVLQITDMVHSAPPQLRGLTEQLLLVFQF